MKNMNVKSIITLVMLSFFQLMTFNVQAQSSEEEQVKEVLNKYNSALESLDVKGTDILFVSNSQILETGKIEGTYQDYIAHHIGPELGHFKSFTYSNYVVEVTVDLPYAFTTESYLYTIVLKEEEKVIEREGVSTTVLKKIGEDWKIVKSHNSGRKPKK
jgi:ketosteroid isomerase-like protein